MGNVRNSEVASSERLEGSEVARWERWERCEGSEVARWKRWESSEVVRWEVPGFIQGWGMESQSKISSFWIRMGSRLSCVAAEMERFSLDLIRKLLKIVRFGSVWNL